MGLISKARKELRRFDDRVRKTGRDIDDQVRKIHRDIDDKVRAAASDADDWRRENPELSAIIAGGALLAGGSALGLIGSDAGAAGAGGAILAQS